MTKAAFIIASIVGLSACSSSPEKVKSNYAYIPVKQSVLKTETAYKPSKGNLIVTSMDEVVKISDRCELEIESDGQFDKNDIGARSVDVVKGFANEIPFEVFVTQVLPKGFKVFWQDSISKSIDLSWKGGKPWLELLDDAGKKLGNKLIINMNQKLLLIGAAEKNKGGVYYIAKGAQEDSCIPYFVMRDWTVKKGERIVDVVSRWSEEANWKVIWAIDTKMRVLTGVKLHGDFVDAVQGLIGMATSDGVIGTDVVLKYSAGKKTVTVFKERKDL